MRKKKSQKIFEKKITYRLEGGGGLKVMQTS